MKTKGVLCFLLSLILVSGIFYGCGTSSTSSNVVSSQPSPKEQGEVRPEDEYERSIWYGFLPEDLVDADQNTTMVTWEQYCSMLGNMIKLHDESIVSEWQALTKEAPDTKMRRDGAINVI